MSYTVRASALAIVVVLGACTAGPGQTAPPSSPPISPSAPVEPSTSAAPSPEGGAPNSYDLLNLALAAGEIDDEQALVYKVFASFNDPRLPAEYKGDDAELHDGMVIAEALARWTTLSAETRAALTPFTLWPDQEGSWLRQRIEGAPVAVLGQVAQAEDVILPVEGSANVLVWYRKDRPADQALAQSIVSMVDGQLWPKLIGLMGPPLSDLGMGNPEGNGEDPRIDIVLTGEDIRSYAHPFGCHETSGVINLGADGATLAVLTHELMHVIQFKYPVSGGCQHPAYAWLHEATAQWSIDFIDPATQAERGTRTGLLPKETFLDVPGYPLDLRNDRHEYGAYLFFQYLGRSLGPEYIPAVWEAAAGEDSLGAINSVVASAGGLSEVWPDFALAAYNQDPSTRFRDWDGLPYGARVTQELVALDGASSREFFARAGVEHVAALYTGFRFEDANIKKVTFSHSLSGNPDARVTAVVKYESEAWTVEDWTPFAEKTWCYEEDGVQRLEQLIIIVTNSGHEAGSAALPGPQPKLTVADTCSCGDPARAVSWAGTLKFAYDGAGGGTQVHRAADVTLDFNEVYLDEEDTKTWIGEYTGGSAEERDSRTYPDHTDTVTGGPITRARGSLNLDKQSCLFKFGFSVTIMSTYDQYGNTFEAESTIGEVELFDLPGSETAVGFVGQVPAYVLGGGPGENMLFLVSGGQIPGGYEFELEDALGEDGLGSASVELSLTPTYPPNE